MKWTVRDIPGQSGRRAVVTGATSGIGFETAAALAAAGCEVVLVGRDPEKGRAAIDRLRGRASPELVRFEAADLADMGAVRSLAERLNALGGPLDMLIDNAGIMAPPERRATPEGVELQFQVNYLSHFALTGLLRRRLELAPAARVVAVSSNAARFAPIDFADLQSERYEPFQAYGRSKTAMLMFALALQRRGGAGGWSTGGYAAHPGWAATALMTPEPVGATLAKTLMSLTSPMLAQPPAQGALPILFAATAPQAKGGRYYGPDGPGELRGHPTEVKPPDFATDAAAQDRLWAESVRLSGVDWG